MRYHLWFAHPSRRRASWSADAPPRGNGRSPASPLLRRFSSGGSGGCSEGYWAALLSPVPPNRGLSGQEYVRLLFLFAAVWQLYHSRAGLSTTRMGAACPGQAAPIRKVYTPFKLY